MWDKRCCVCCSDADLLKSVRLLTVRIQSYLAIDVFARKEAAQKRSRFRIGVWCVEHMSLCQQSLSRACGSSSRRSTQADCLPEWTFALAEARCSDCRVNRWSHCVYHNVPSVGHCAWRTQGIRTLMLASERPVYYRASFKHYVAELLQRLWHRQMWAVTVNWALLGFTVYHETRSLVPY